MLTVTGTLNYGISIHIYSSFKNPVRDEFYCLGVLGPFNNLCHIKTHRAKNVIRKAKGALDRANDPLLYSE